MKKLIALLCCMIALNAYSQTVITHCSTIDVRTGKLLTDQAAIIEGEKITWTGPASKVKVPAGARTIDATGKFLMPGLIDTHIHFFQSGGLYTRPDAADFTSKVPYTEELAFAKANIDDYFKRYLRLGITTVVDVGGPMTNFMVRDSLRLKTLAPDVLVTGPLFSMVDRPQLDKGDPPIVKITSKADIDALYAKMLPGKPDFIKIWYIAGPQLPAANSLPLVKYVAEIAAKNNLKLAVHATQLETAQLAVEAGASILVHSVDDQVVPDSFVKLLKDKKVTYIPTLIVSANYAKTFAGKLPDHIQDLRYANPFAYGSLKDLEGMKETDMPARIATMRKSGMPARYAKGDSIMAINLVKLWKGGVNIATGTDAGNIGTLHASSYLQELQYMEKAGLTRADILKASTLNAAAGFGREAQTGTIEKGKNADIILLKSNPLESLDNLNSIEWVMTKGKLISPDSLAKESPVTLVQRQLVAYNARNIDEFLSTYSEDVELYDGDTGKLTTKGKASMKKGYGAFFKGTPNLHCTIQNRITVGNKVIDKEWVRAGEREFGAVAIYEVNNGLITKVTFYR